MCYLLFVQALCWCSTYSSIDRTRRGLLQPARKHCFMGQKRGVILHLLVLYLLGDTALTPPAGRGPRGDSSRWLRAGAGTGSPGPVSPVGKERKGKREGNRSGSPSRGQPAACGSRSGTARPLLRRHPARQGRNSSSLGNEQQKPAGRSLPARVNRSLLGSSRKS